jgi:hypothetical protein
MVNTVNSESLKSQTLADHWNRSNVTGRAVLVRRDDGSVFKTATRSSAFVTGAGDAVIFLDGIRGYYLLDRVEPYEGTREVADFTHASGECFCERCGRDYFHHPRDFEHLGPDAVPYLVQLCNGSLVKL